MPPKKELCRNFQRGSCKYGARCNYSHQLSQQPRTSPFGNDTQGTNQFQTSNTQQPNPFGFGVKSGSQPRGVADFGSKQNPSKPFENKWSRQPDNQPPQATQQTHTCTDPESCKRQIKEDFEHEKPLWKLTCYGHNKSSPCDIVGDISFEELRASAYNDAKQGLAMQFIVEKERNLLNAKLQEFENLLHNPYTARQTPVSTTQNSFSATSPAASSIPAQNNSPLSVSSFSQLAASPIKGFGHSFGNNAFGQTPTHQTSFQAANGSGTNTSPFARAAGSVHRQLPNHSFGNVFSSNAANFNNVATGAGQTPTHQTSFQAANGSATNTSPFARAAGSVHGQLPNHSFGNVFSSNAANFNNVATGAGQNIFPSSIPNNSGNNHSMMGLNGPANVSPLFPSLTNNQSQMGFNALNSTVDAAGSSSLNMKTSSDGNNSAVIIDKGIWSKAEWIVGEIPEEAPPDDVIF